MLRRDFICSAGPNRGPLKMEVHLVEPSRNDSGQTTAEYALVLLVAGLVVGVFATFVRSGALMDMFETIVSGLVDRANG